MVSITACPECSQDVTIPDGLPREASVRCPLCEAEFLLADVVDSTREVVFAADVSELQLVELAPGPTGELAAQPDPLGCEPEALPGDPEPLPGEPELVSGRTAAAEDESPLDVELLDDLADDPEDEADSDSSSDVQQEASQADDSIDLAEYAEPEPVDEPANQADGEQKEEPIEAELVETEANGAEDDTEDEVADEADEPDAACHGDEKSDAQDASTDAPLSVRCPCCEAEFPLHTLIVAATGDPLGEQAAAAIASDGSPASGPSFDFVPRTDDSPDPADGAFDFVADSQPSDGEAPSLAVSKSKRRKKEKSLVRELFGVFVGGAAGLLIMYYGLNFFGGERFDMAEIYLPGIQHTAKHKPDWWPNWLLFNTDAEDSQPNDRHDPDLGPTDFENRGGLVRRPRGLGTGASRTAQV